MNESNSDISSTLGLGRQRRRRRYLLWLLPLLAASLLLATLLPDDQGADYRHRTVKVTRGDLRLTVTATGNLQPLKQVEVGSELSGTIADVEVDFNDEVEAGQVLARLDTSTLENRIAEAEASLQSAEAKVKEAEATELEKALALKRCRELAKQKMCSQNDVDAAVAAHARSRAGVASAEAQVAIAQAVLAGHRTNLAKATIRSPIHGIVLDRKVEPGQTVAASFQTPELFTLAEDLARMELIVAIDEADIGRIRHGQAASFNVDAFPERRFTAAITQVRRAPQTVEGVVSYDTVLTVDNEGLQLLPGMTATAEIVVREIAGALLIPNAALRYSPPPAEEGAKGDGNLFSRLFFRPRHQRNGRQARAQGATRQVWQLKEGVPAALTIRTGDSDGQHTEVLEGLEPGMELLSESSRIGG